MSPDEASMPLTPPSEAPRPDSPAPAPPPGAGGLLFKSLTALVGGQVVGVLVVLVARSSLRSAPGATASPIHDIFSAPYYPWVMAAGSLATILMTIGFARGAAEGWRMRLGWVRPSVPAREIATVVIGTLALQLALFVAMVGLRLAGLFPDDSRSLTLSSRVDSEGSLATLWLMLVVAAVVVPVQEESLFRGYLQRGLLARWRPALAIAVTAILFGAMHVVPILMLVIVPVALWQSWIAWRTRSVIPGAISHGIWNGTLSGLSIAQRIAHVKPSADDLRGILFGHPYAHWAPPLAMLGLAVAGLCARRLQLAARASDGSVSAPAPFDGASEVGHR
jgi:uncharacterized protein